MSVRPAMLEYQADHEASAKSFLRRSAVGRAVLLILSAGAIAFSVVFLFALAIGPAGRALQERVIRIAIAEFLTAMFATGSVGVMWAIATPSWLPNVALRTARRMALYLFIGLAILIGLLTW